MALFQRKHTVAQVERRVARRHAVDCAARLQLLGGERAGRLSDLSVEGARLETTDPPASGISGLLAWGEEEYWCKVVWSRETSCGLVFERTISQSIVDATAGTAEVETGPAADFSKIPLGERRGRRMALVPKD